MRVDYLMYRQPELDAEEFLPLSEIVERVREAFPLAVIDHERADEIVRRNVAELELYMPSTDMIVEQQRGLLGRVVYVTVREEAAGPSMGFFLFPEPTMINIEYERPEDREACRPLLEGLAAVMEEYDVLEDEIEDENDNLGRTD